MEGYGPLDHWGRVRWVGDLAVQFSMILLMDLDVYLGLNEELGQ